MRAELAAKLQAAEAATASAQEQHDALRATMVVDFAQQQLALEASLEETLVETKGRASEELCKRARKQLNRCVGPQGSMAAGNPDGPRGCGRSADIPASGPERCQAARRGAEGGRRGAA